MSAQVCTKGARVTRRSYRIHDRDFVVNAIWEGAGDELHSNDVYAAETEFGVRIISGIALMSLCVSRVMGERGWLEPLKATVSFDSAVTAGDCVDIELTETVPGDAIEVAVEGRRVLHIDLRHTDCFLADRSSEFLKSKGRTFTSGDREVFDWWISSSLPEVQPAPEGMVPWPMLASVISGFIGRLDIVKSPHTSLVNRFNDWTFFRSARIGETIHAEVHEATERISRSKPGWGIWTARVLAISDTQGDVIGFANWVCMFMLTQEH